MTRLQQVIPQKAKHPYQTTFSLISRWFEYDSCRQMVVLLISLQTAAVFPQVGYNYIVLRNTYIVLLIIFSSCDMKATQNLRFTSSLIGLPFEKVCLLQKLLLMILEFSYLRHEENGQELKKLTLKLLAVSAGIILLLHVTQTNLLKDKFDM